MSDSRKGTGQRDSACYLHVWLVVRRSAGSAERLQGFEATKIGVLCSRWREDAAIKITCKRKDGATSALMVRYLMQSNAYGT